MNHVLNGREIRVLDAWLGFLGCLVIYVTSFIVAPFIFRLLPWFQEDFIYLMMMVIPPLLIPIIYFTFRYERIRFADLVPQRKDFLVLFIALIFLFLWFSFTMFQGTRSDELAKQIYNLPGYQGVLAISLVVLIGPFLEEILFRKYILGILLHKYHLFTAVLVTVSLETLMHIGVLVEGFGIKALVKIFIILLLYTIVYLNSRLGVSVIVHCLYNFIITWLTWPGFHQIPQGMHIY